MVQEAASDTDSYCLSATNSANDLALASPGRRLVEVLSDSFYITDSSIRQKLSHENVPQHAKVWNVPSAGTKETDAQDAPSGCPTECHFRKLQQSYNAHQSM